MDGVAFVAYGDKAKSELEQSIKELRKHCNHPFIVISDRKIKPYRTVVFDALYKPIRWPKLCINLLTPFKRTLYLDVDTRVRQPIEAGFQMLTDGWDIVIAPSGQQDEESMWHVEKDERELTLNALGFNQVLQLQAGVFWFKKSERVDEFFFNWRMEWTKKFKGQDQAAMLRALYQTPVKVWLLGRCWNGGAVINHLFGRLR